ncbi:hypothetical protein AMECASPLE_009949, partial [Ameca splendens]
MLDFAERLKLKLYSYEISQKLELGIILTFYKWLSDVSMEPSSSGVIKQTASEADRQQHRPVCTVWIFSRQWQHQQGALAWKSHLSCCVLGQDISPALPADGGPRARWHRLYGSLTSACVPQGSCGYSVAHHLT